MSDPIDTGIPSYPEANGQPEPQQPSSPKPTLVIEYDPATKACRWQIVGSFPHGDLVWAMELVKATVVQTTLMQAMAAQQAEQRKKIVLPDGSPANFLR